MTVNDFAFSSAFLFALSSRETPSKMRPKSRQKDKQKHEDNQTNASQADREMFLQAFESKHQFDPYKHDARNHLNLLEICSNLLSYKCTKST